MDEQNSWLQRLNQEIKDLSGFLILAQITFTAGMM